MQRLYSKKAPSSTELSIFESANSVALPRTRNETTMRKKQNQKGCYGLEAIVGTS